jgi:hypothetical protein
MSQSSASAGYEPPADRTSKTDDERIKNVIPLPPPEHPGGNAGGGHAQGDPSDHERAG